MLLFMLLSAAEVAQRRERQTTTPSPHGRWGPTDATMTGGSILVCQEVRQELSVHE